MYYCGKCKHIKVKDVTKRYLIINCKCSLNLIILKLVLILLNNSYNNDDFFKTIVLNCVLGFFFLKLPVKDDTSEVKFVMFDDETEQCSNKTCAELIEAVNNCLYVLFFSRLMNILFLTPTLFLRLGNSSTKSRFSSTC